MTGTVCIRTIHRPVWSHSSAHIIPYMPGWSCSGMALCGLMKKMLMLNSGHSNTSMQAAGASDT